MVRLKLTYLSRDGTGRFKRRTETFAAERTQEVESLLRHKQRNGTHIESDVIVTNVQTGEKSIIPEDWLL